MNNKMATNEVKPITKTADSVKKETVENTKFNKMEKFLRDNDIKVFSVEKVNDKMLTTVFRSRMEVKEQILPFAILIDNTIYTLLQVQIAPAVAKDEQSFLKIASYVNKLNDKYRVFKFNVSEDGALLLNVCLTAKDNDFDPIMIHLVLGEILKFLEAEYIGIMKTIAATRA
jgi:hypothetical protein